MESIKEPIGRATYSPEDNKLRMYPFDRLDEAVYTRMKRNGFAWAPKQKLFVTPMWTPDRHDLLMELCGDVGDEDTSLMERAEDRNERFSELSEKREEEGDRAASANIMGGEGAIIIGHHSERRAQKEADKIKNQLKKVLNCFETARYWKERAAGALANAKYKDLPEVRFRRIKGLEADLRKQEKSLAQDEKILKNLSKELTEPMLAWILGQTIVGRACDAYSRLRSGENWEVLLKELREHYSTPNAWATRWAEHYRNRIAYERAMLGEAGAVVLEAQEWDIKAGGKVCIGSEWFVVVRANKKDGKNLSVRVAGNRYIPIVGIESIKGYQEPTKDQVKAVKAATSYGPLVNRRSEGCIEMTSEEWKKKSSYADAYFAKKYKATEEHGAYRERQFYSMMKYQSVLVFLTDAKEVPIPPPEKVEVAKIATPERDHNAPEPVQRTWAKDELDMKVDAMRQAVKSGVQVAVAPQLFPTPVELAARIVQEAEITFGMTILEPSAGTGRILDQLTNEELSRTCAIEINGKLVDGLRDKFVNHKNLIAQRMKLVQMDFLEFTGKTFDRILMNPPFGDAQDIAHIEHALTLLNPKGRLVAICAGGPRQKAKLYDRCTTWEELPEGTFKESGTNVNTVMLTIDN